MAQSHSHDLSQYKAKRNFSITAEPKPKHGKVGSHIFVIQRHWATREHFDLRLEMHGVMVSWAVTRGPSTNPKDKRLAVKVEDHPVSYSDFEGTIPKGQYGGGTVMIWDRGTWESLDEDEEKALRAGRMKLEFHGERMRGAYALVRMRSEEKRENWLLIKERDEYATAKSDMPGEHTTSVITGRSRDEIAGGEATKLLNKAVPDMEVERHSFKRAPAAFVKPMLCKLVEEPPEGNNWAHEEKYDGYRIQIVKHGEDVHLYSREGLDWTAKFPSIAKAALKLKANAATIDGEAVIYNDQRVTDFPLFVEALKERPADIQYMAFDILNFDGEDLRSEPLSARKEMLEKVMPAKDKHLHLSAYTVGDGAKRFADSAKRKTEGIVSKRWDSRYISGRSDAWVKSKHGTREDVIVVGYVPSQRGRAFGSLVTAIENKEELAFSGGVGTGFGVQEQNEILAELKKLERKGPSPLLRNAKLAPSVTRWVEPRMRIEVAMSGWTKDNQLRHPRYLALRSVASESKKAAEMSEKAPARAAKASAKTTITHGDRVMFPKAGVTKQDLADYYEKVADLILPHLAGRPMSFVRAPESIAKETFFQRHVMPGMKNGISRIPDPEGKHADFVTIDDASGLHTIAQFSIVELHGWGSKVPKLENPDRMVFDLDPDEAVKFPAVRDAALQLRDMLTDIGLVSFPMLSGGKGLHVIVPLDATQDWDTISDFTKGMARGLAETDPERFVATASKERRKGKIYIDWLRNKMTATAIQPWSVRARETASIAAPVTWDALPDFKSPAAFTTKNPPMKNPWRTFFTVKQRIDDKAVEFLRNRWR